VLAWRDDGAACESCAADYRFVRGIPTFLTADAADDIWAAAESGLARALRENPELERALMDPPPEALGPADRMFRSFVLEERGDFESARASAPDMSELYTPEMNTCRQKAFTALLERLDGPVVDLASGRCLLLERMNVPAVATDVSPLVLSRARERGIAGEALAFDARRTPFADGAVETMTTFLGLANVEDPGPLFGELRRVVSGRLLAIHMLYPEGDANAEAIEAMRLERLLYRELFLDGLATAGWDTEVVFECRARALPTPVGNVLEAAVDGLPVAPTEIDWVVIEAH
jgi:methyltransferase family protein